MYERLTEMILNDMFCHIEDDTLVHIALRQTLLFTLDSWAGWNAAVVGFGSRIPYVRDTAHCRNSSTFYNYKNPLLIYAVTSHTKTMDSELNTTASYLRTNQKLRMYLLFCSHFYVLTYCNEKFLRWRHNLRIDFCTLKLT